jgi:hypothetical protein
MASFLCLGFVPAEHRNAFVVLRAFNSEVQTTDPTANVDMRTGLTNNRSLSREEPLQIRAKRTRVLTAVATVQLALVAERASEIAIGEMRMQWWKDVLDMVRSRTMQAPS